MTEAQIKHMVDRFLNWKLPEDFNPDAGISFEKTYNNGTTTPAKHEPVGTNLFTAEQAKAMVRHMIEGLPAATLSQPVGWKMVPVEADWKMQIAAREADWPLPDIYGEMKDTDKDQASADIFRRIVAAAPASPIAGERNGVLEEVVKYHEKEIARLGQQIAENNDYITRSGVAEGDANTYCRTKLMVHEQSIAAIRALAEGKEL